MAERIGSRKIQSLERALDVLDALQRGPRRVSDLARDTGSSKATVHHILATLEDRRIVIREPGSFRYQLSWGIYELGAGVVHGTGYNSVIPPLISELAEEIGETTLFAIEESGEALVLYRGECTRSVLVANNIPGRRIPMHATASGKTLLAYSPQLFARLARTLPAYTAKTAITHEAVQRQLKVVRRRGYATCWEEHEISLNSIAVPVFGVAGVLAGALTIAGPSGRLNQRTYKQYLTPLAETARRIHEHVDLPAAGQT